MDLQFRLPTNQTIKTNQDVLDIQDMISKRRTELEQRIESLKIERRQLLLESKRIKKLERQVEEIEEKALPDEILEIAMKFPMITSKRELEVLYCMSKFFTVRQIGQALFITDKTVKFHRTNIYKQLKCKNEKEVLRKLMRND